MTERTSQKHYQLYCYDEIILTTVARCKKKVSQDFWEIYTLAYIKHAKDVCAYSASDQNISENSQPLCLMKQSISAIRIFLKMCDRFNSTLLCWICDIYNNGRIWQIDTGSGLADKWGCNRLGNIVLLKKHRNHRVSWGSILARILWYSFIPIKKFMASAKCGEKNLWHP